MYCFFGCMWIRLGTLRRKEGRKKKQVEGRVRGWHLPEKKISLLDGCVFLLFLFPCFVVPSSFYVNTHSILPPSTVVHSPFLYLLTSFIINWLSSSFICTSIHPSAGELYTYLRTVCASKGNGLHLPPHSASAILLLPRNSVSHCNGWAI